MESESEGVASTPSFSIFDFSGMKSLSPEFGCDNFSGFKMASPQSWNAHFSALLSNEIEDLYY